MQFPRFEYSPIIHRPHVAWPNNARVAVWVIPNIEHYAPNIPSTSIHFISNFDPDILNYSWRDYGVRVGIWRLMQCMDKYGVRGTVALNSDVCKHYPQIIEEALKRDWEFMGHGTNNSQLIPGLTLEEERALVKEVVDTITESTGSAPKGWLSPALGETYNTPDLLTEHGIQYVGNWVNDDLPYPMQTANGPLYSIPYSIEINDIPIFLGQGHTPQGFTDTLIEQFDVLYEEGAAQPKVMAICLHPFLIGHPFRIRALEKVFQHITSHDDVWLATGSEIIDSYRKQTESGEKAASVK